MRYALLVYGDQSAWAELEEEEAARLRAESMPRWLALFEEMRTADPGVEGRELAAAAEAKVVRVVGGERVVTDGPFAETKEQLLGFYIVDCSSLDAALETARELATANPGTGSYEVRPVAEFHEYTVGQQQKPAA